MRKELLGALLVVCMGGVLMAAPVDNDGKGINKMPPHQKMMCKGHGFACPVIGRHNLKFLAKKLDLTKEQVRSLEGAKAEFDKVVIPIGIDKKLAHKDLREAFISETLDEAKVGTIQANLADLQKKTMDAELVAVKAVRSILTADQLKKLSQLPEEMMKMKGKNGWGKDKGKDDAKSSNDEK